MMTLIRLIQYSLRLPTELALFLQMPHKRHRISHVEHHNAFSARRLSASDNSRRT